MKSKYFIPIIIIILIEISILFFFPKPETNFFFYIGTAIFLIIATTALIKWQKKTNKKLTNKAH